MHGLYTAFAPTDEAFGKLPKKVVDSLFQPENDERLEDIVSSTTLLVVYSRTENLQAIE